MLFSTANAIVDASVRDWQEGRSHENRPSSPTSFKYSPPDVDSDLELAHPGDFPIQFERALDKIRRLGFLLSRFATNVPYHNVLYHYFAFDCAPLGFNAIAKNDEPGESMQIRACVRRNGKYDCDCEVRHNL
ncbi:hypothetical protein [Caballeronia sp. DA-9]|uniref:hypothetical protein n=1 Tax=Caballeronia sp. DA-9 TaxID=3436237 RepID=UPI003F67B6B0